MVGRRVLYPVRVSGTGLLAPSTTRPCAPMIITAHRDAVDDVDLRLLRGRELAAHETRVAGGHGVELRVAAPGKLAPIGCPSVRGVHRFAGPATDMSV